MDERLKEIQDEAYEDLKKLYGLPPYGECNPCYSDGMFATSLIDKYGMSIAALKEWVGFISDPRALVIEQLKHWLKKFDEKDHPERMTSVQKGTLEDLVRLLETGRTKKQFLTLSLKFCKVYER